MKILRGPNPEIICMKVTSKSRSMKACPDGTDSGQEWVELYNAGLSLCEWMGWTIGTASSSWSSKATIPAGTSLEPGAFYLRKSDVPSEFADLTLDSNLVWGTHLLVSMVFD